MVNNIIMSGEQYSWGNIIHSDIRTAATNSLCMVMCVVIGYSKQFESDEDIFL